MSSPIRTATLIQPMTTYQATKGLGDPVTDGGSCDPVKDAASICIFRRGCDSTQRVRSLRISGNNSPSFVVRERENSGRRPATCSAGPTIPVEIAKPLLFSEQGKEEGLCFSFPSNAKRN
jgi:hypothetical protein